MTHCMQANTVFCTFVYSLLFTSHTACGRILSEILHFTLLESTAPGGVCCLVCSSDCVSNTVCNEHQREVVQRPAHTAELLQVKLGVQGALQFFADSATVPTVCKVHSLYSTGCAGVQQYYPDSDTVCSCTASKFQLQLQVNLGVHCAVSPRPCYTIICSAQCTGHRLCRCAAVFPRLCV